MIFASILWIFIFGKARGQFAREINVVNCEFDSSQCGWTHYKGTSPWKMSNSTQETDIPDNGRNFLLLRGTATKLSVSMLISPYFQTLPSNISLNQRVFCSGRPELSLNFLEITNRQMEFLVDVSCPKDGSWEEIEEYSAVDPDDIENDEITIGFQIVLIGTVNQGDVIAIQDLRFRDNTAVVTGSSTTFTESDTKNETSTTSLTTWSSTTFTESDTKNESSTTSLTTMSNEEDLQSTTGTDFSSIEVNSTVKNNFSSSSSQSITEDYQNDTTSVFPEYKSPEETTVTLLTTKSSSTEKILITTPTDTCNYTDITSNVTEDIYTKNSTLTSSRDLEIQTNSSAIFTHIISSSSQSEDENQTTTTVASLEDSTFSTTDSANKELIVEKNGFLWRTVFISTMTAFLVYSLLSLLASLIRRLIRRRKQWVLGRRSQNTTVSVEDGEVITLSAISKL